MGKEDSARKYVIEQLKPAFEPSVGLNATIVRLASRVETLLRERESEGRVKESPDLRGALLSAREIARAKYAENLPYLEPACQTHRTEKWNRQDRWGEGWDRCLYIPEEVTTSYEHSNSLLASPVFYDRLGWALIDHQEALPQGPMIQEYLQGLINFAQETGSEPEGWRNVSMSFRGNTSKAGDERVTFDDFLENAKRFPAKAALKGLMGAGALFTLAEFYREESRENKIARRAPVSAEFIPEKDGFTISTKMWTGIVYPGEINTEGGQTLSLVRSTARSEVLQSTDWRFGDVIERYKVNLDGIQQRLEARTGMSGNVYYVLIPEN
ncbi:MAG: hypothetical protein WC897_03100 [Candidatus Gracilibacteria bacterium]